jgi:glutaredoxin
MKQECNLWSVWLTWLGLPALAMVMGIFEGWFAAILVLIAGIFAEAIYIRQFPRVSRLLGYGSVEDTIPPPTLEPKRVSRVILYTANVCPFCPLVRRRLLDLQKKLGFDLTEIDITFQPGLAREKGFRSVPVIEIDGRHWVGNGTSAEIASFLTRKE